MQEISKVEDLDRMFDILLVLIGIVSATLFQFVCAVAPLQIAAENPNLPQDQLSVLIAEEIVRWLRVFFIPVILLITIWFLNRIAMAERLGAKRTISEFCYVIGFTILAHYILYFIGAVTMQPLTEVTAYTIGGGLLSLLITSMVFLVSLGLVYKYEALAAQAAKVGTQSIRRRLLRIVLLRTILLWFAALAIINVIEMLSIWEFI